MSAFLDIVSEEGTKATLAGWIRASVGGMDRAVMNGFSAMLGADWRNSASDFFSAARAKLLRRVFEESLTNSAMDINVRQFPAKSEVSAPDQFDAYFFEYHVEDTLSPDGIVLSFANGKKCGEGKETSRILAVKVIGEDYQTKQIFAAAVDTDKIADKKKTRWRSEITKGFSVLKVAAEDAGIVVPLCGGIAPRTRGQKYVGIEYERFSGHRLAALREQELMLMLPRWDNVEGERIH